MTEIRWRYICLACGWHDDSWFAETDEYERSDCPDCGRTITTEVWEFHRGQEPPDDNVMTVTDPTWPSTPPNLLVARPSAKPKEGT